MFARILVIVHYVQQFFNIATVPSLQSTMTLIEGKADSGPEDTSPRKQSLHTRPFLRFRIITS